MKIGYAITEETKMGDIEQLVAEPDEIDENEEDVDGLHPPTLSERSPWLIVQVLNSVIYIFQACGWYFLGFSLIGYLLWRKFEPQILTWRKKREEAEESAALRKDPDKYLAREMAIDRARQRMQERYNQSAEEYIEKQKEREEKKRQERLEELERQARGEGSRLVSRASASSASLPSSSGAAAGSTTDKKSGKAKLRPEYNPLMGDTGGSCSWRSSRPSASGGG